MSSSRKSGQWYSKAIHNGLIAALHSRINNELHKLLGIQLDVEQCFKAFLRNQCQMTMV